MTREEFEELYPIDKNEYGYPSEFDKPIDCTGWKDWYLNKENE